MVVSAGEDPVTGELRSVGQDVATIRLDGEAQAQVYFLVANVAEVVLFA
jgi:hypothetical protein